MKLLSYIFPQTIIQTSSKYNRDIRVVVENGKKKLLVNGIQQSGPGVQKFWDFAFTHLPLPHTAYSILVFGVGGGTVFKKLHQIYPHAAITGVDIDSVIGNIAKEYFQVNDEIMISDAKRFKTKKKYDLVIVDLYIGRDIPHFESSESFVRNLKKIGKTVVFNFLHDGIFEKRAQLLEILLRKEFTVVTIADLPYNRFFCVVK